MEPLTIISLASSLLKAGPTLIKTVGGLFGEKSSSTAIKVADAVEQVSASLTSPEAQQLKVEQLLKTLSPAELKQLETVQVELAQIDAEREARQLAHQETIFETGQQTIRAGDSSANDNVASCRPNLAYISMSATAIYVVGMSLANAWSYGLGPDMAVAAFLISPAGAYMGLRHREKGQGTAS
ncbi:hypothetical protein [Photobacterium sanguinicancri]|uniref:hypothetical protein n=1 Tax=Photobacterium sanguinicancri TaxID=875932 RepID=UPI0026E40AE6|nr:hypothetical protein [Photobacterium sanguinicancri]MDO6497343.1 hypothetical protein [Photobacterium sanguinicancri]